VKLDLTLFFVRVNSTDALLPETRYITDFLISQFYFDLIILFQTLVTVSVNATKNVTL